MEDIDYELLRTNIRNERIKKGLTQEQLANRLDTVSSYISDIETGRKKPSIRMLYLIASELGTGIDRLVFGNDHYHTDPFTKAVMKIFNQADENKKAFLFSLLKELSKAYDKYIK